jgi:competence ComEA-like helix-hairpin-helix protein
MERSPQIVIPSGARNPSALRTCQSESCQDKFREGSLLACTFLLISLVLVGALASAFAQKKMPPTKPVDLNTATVEQLQQLPGVGPVTAKSIVDFRKRSGPFRRVDDLLAIRGISNGRLKQIRPYVFVAPAKPAAAKPSAATPKAPPPSTRPTPGKQ